MSEVLNAIMPAYSFVIHGVTISVKNSMKMYEVESVLDELSKVHTILQTLSDPRKSVDDKDIVDAVSSLKASRSRIDCAPEIDSGVHGKGDGQNYALFCRRCFREYASNDLTGCSNCGSPKLCSRADRQSELRGKVEVLKEAYLRHKNRKDLWYRYEEGSVNSGRLQSGVTDYDRWSKWEPETSDDDEINQLGPIIPRHDAGFRDLESRLT